MEIVGERHLQSSPSPSQVNVSGFDYPSLPVDAVAELKVAANKIRALHRQSITNILAIGKHLTAAKDLTRGRFGDWIAAEFGMTWRSAQNYMAAAKWAVDRCEMISHLDPSAVYILSRKSTPEAAAQQVLDRLERGERLTTRDVRDVITNATPPRKRKPVRSTPTARQRAKLEREKEQAEAKRRASEEAAGKLANLIRLTASDKVLLGDLFAATKPWDLWTALRRALGQPVAGRR